jgi:hypothetical protein
MWALGFGWRRTTAVTSYWDRFLDDAEAEDEAASGSFVATTIVCFVAIDADSIYDCRGRGIPERSDRSILTSGIYSNSLVRQPFLLASIHSELYRSGLEYRQRP